MEHDILDRLEETRPYYPNAPVHKRAINWVIDLVGWYVFYIVVSTLGIFPFFWVFKIEPARLMDTIPGIMLTLVFGVLALPGTYWLYYVVFEGLAKGKTLGKWITGTRAVMGENSERLPRKVVYKRSILRLIPIDAFTFFGSEGWHDKLSGTRVIEDGNWRAQ